MLSLDVKEKQYARFEGSSTIVDEIARIDAKFVNVTGA